MDLNREIVLINAASQLGAGKRAIGDGWQSRVNYLNQYLTDAGIKIAGTIEINEPAAKKGSIGGAHFLKEVQMVCQKVQETVTTCLESNQFPILLGGDHSLAMGSITAVKHFQISKGQSLGVLWSDAHIDINTRQTSPSGNVHGMALAGLLGMNNGVWNPAFGERGLRGEEVLALGLRFTDQSELPNLFRSKVRYHTMREIHRVGFPEVLEESVRPFIAGYDSLHLSFDLDGLDPSIAPGVNTPFPGGLSFREAHQLCELVHYSGKLISLDLVEHVPSDETDNQMLPIIGELIAACLGRSMMPT